MNYDHVPSFSMKIHNFPTKIHHFSMKMASWWYTSFSDDRAGHSHVYHARTITFVQARVKHPYRKATRVTNWFQIPSNQIHYKSTFIHLSPYNSKSIYYSNLSNMYRLMTFTKVSVNPSPARMFSASTAGPSL